MMCYEFIARDRAGLALDQVDGEIEWVGNSKQWSEAEFQEMFFLNEGFWPEKNNF